MILAKYDFWPGLLDAAARSRAPVLVINAQMRNSLRRMVHIFRFLGVKFPQLFLFPNDIIAEGELKANLGDTVSLFLSVDPRWERVERRIELKKSSRSLNEWSKRISELKKPIGMVGSAWIEDLAVILPALKNRTDSLVVVPHESERKKRRPNGSTH